jgi:hypothetical protein
MMTLVGYLVIAVAVLGLAVWLVHEKPEREPWEAEDDFAAGCLSNPSFLNLSRRVFDPTDYRWLRDELCFPQAAEVLARDRKRLALKWLRALRRQFKELVRLPEPAPDGSAAGAASGWQLLGLTLRFQLLLAYAILVVRLFGPYHRLVLPLAWVHSLSLEGVRGLGSRMLGTRHLA